MDPILLLLQNIELNGVEIPSRKYDSMDTSLYEKLLSGKYISVDEQDTTNEDGEVVDTLKVFSVTDSGIAVMASVREQKEIVQAQAQHDYQMQQLQNAKDAAVATLTAKKTDAQATVADSKASQLDKDAAALAVSDSDAAIAAKQKEIDAKIDEISASKDELTQNLSETTDLLEKLTK